MTGSADPFSQGTAVALTLLLQQILRHSPAFLQLV
jgi:hypothetical protein